jgi:uncharacterized protein involved in type VI secretion and phage assembly
MKPRYEETAFNFVSRLMEDEGIFYFFEHHEDKHVLVLADNLAIHAPCSGIPTARFLTVTNDTQPEDAITEYHFQQQVTPGRYAVDDFNFEIPTADLRTSIQGQGSELRIYEYAAGFSNKDQGDNKVKRRIQEQEFHIKQLEGQGHCLSQEVIVNFLNGNPDEPLVTGSVYNAQQVVPYPLPAEQTKSTLKSNSSKGGNGFLDYLPAYSPDLNPLEHQWAQAKAIRKQKDCSVEELFTHEVS